MVCKEGRCFSGPKWLVCLIPKPPKFSKIILLLRPSYVFIFLGLDLLILPKRKKEKEKPNLSFFNSREREKESKGEMGKQIVGIVLLISVFTLVISTMEVAALVTPNFNDCHGVCEKDCTDGGASEEFCKLKCSNFCADNILVSLTNERGKSDSDQDNHAVDKSASTPLPSDPIEDIEVEISN